MTMVGTDKSNPVFRQCLLWILILGFASSIPLAFAVPVGVDPYGGPNLTHVEGNYRWSFGDQKTFTYGFIIQSAGGPLSRIDIPLRNNERIIKVMGGSWSVQDDLLVILLTEDSANPTVSGYFDANILHTPLNFSGTVLIEADRGKRLLVNTTAIPIGVSQSRVATSLPIGLAYATNGQDTFVVEAKDLGSTPSLVAAVSSATQTFAITDEGSILGEMLYKYDNTGLDYLEISNPGTPLYAANSRGPAKFIDNEYGDSLKVEFPAGAEQALDYVYLTKIPRIHLVDKIDVPLAKTDLPISTMTTRILVPEDWFVLGVLGAKGGNDLPSWRNAFIITILFGILAYMINRKWDFIACYIISAIGLLYLSKTLLYLFVAGSIILAIKDKFSYVSMKWALGVAGSLLVLILIINALLDLKPMIGEFSRSTQNDIAETESGFAQREAMPQFMRFESGMKAPNEIEVPVKVGAIPVKFQLPNMGKTITLTHRIVTKENQPTISLLIISTSLSYAFYLIAFLCGIYGWQIYQKSKLPKPTKRAKQKEARHP